MTPDMTALPVVGGTASSAEDQQPKQGGITGNDYANTSKQKRGRFANGNIWTLNKANRNAQSTSNPKGIEKKRRYEQSEKCRLRRRKYTIAKYREDPKFNLKMRLRRRVRDAIQRQGYRKNTKTMQMLGCDWGHLKQHIESQFLRGMTWDNKHLWHIDHIVPLSSAKTEDELIKLCHWTNLQPLWAEDNLRKGINERSGL
jgi:hypothetical protein